MSATATPAQRDRALRVQCACTALVALGTAYASYRHGREFALRFGADEATAAIRPLIVDGILTTATVEFAEDDRPSCGWQVGCLVVLLVRDPPLASR
ncbi:DUF2637 domain-containing protein [Actinokineospora enzanensis]|uniref:DUF2637 domain-containing protein n=1 Tax=Actinokineospora enzanensis TaxID=155975 RepID=UPI002480B605|nr:DUF2637 domain-containing protein [Actinokineospora enzanensis]